MASFGAKLRHAWNAFIYEDKNYDRVNSFTELGSGFSTRPDRPRLYMSNERSILASILTRLSIDVASAKIRHVRLDTQNNRFSSYISSGLDNCLTVEANIDQGGSAFRQDVALSLFDKGCIAIVPVDTTLNPIETGGFDVNSLRVGYIVQWYPSDVQVSVYNEKIGRRQNVTLPKSMVAIIENPLYTVMNEPNSTLQRLIRKLNLLDAVDDQSASGKLDLIIQLPYVIKSEARKQQANQRRNDIEVQLKGSKYGIAYTDGTEKITQLNRPAENNLLDQVQYLIDLLYSELGLTPEVMNGTANEETMLNYNNRTIEPILRAIVEELKRKFLTKTARSQGQSIEFYHDPFKLVPINNIAAIADKFSRNEILTANEIRSIISFPPSDDPNADKLHNSNMPVNKSLPPGAPLPPQVPTSRTPLALPSPSDTSQPSN